MNQSDLFDDEPRLHRIIATYLSGVEAGETPDRRSLLDQYPDLAEELTTFFANHDRMSTVGGNWQAAPVATRSAAQVEDIETVAFPRVKDADIHSRKDITGSASEPETMLGPVAESVRFFGNYELLGEVARGGMGVVYKARQVNLNRTVAIKMILTGQLASNDDVQRFYAEAEAAANLDHPGIVPIYEVGEHDGQHYFSMGYVEGESLADKIRDGPIPPKDAAEYTRKIATAIAFAHEQGVIHRDLKPANVLLDRNGEPKVTDFGLAKKVEGDGGLTATGQILGTPGYMPPEQAVGETVGIGTAADIYSIGAILYAMCCGRAPFTASNALDTLLQVLDSEATLPSQVQPGVPRALESICMRCLEKRPEDRYATAHDLAEDLHRFQCDEPIEACPADLRQRLRRWFRREPSLVCHLGALLTVLAVLQLRFLISYVDLAYHTRHTVVILVWIGTSLLWQKLLNQAAWDDGARIGWVITDTLLFTTVLYLAEGPLGHLYIGYPMLIAASGLLLRVHLVLVTTAATTAAYIVLMFLRPTEVVRVHYCVLFVVVLLAIGFVLASQVRRIRVLSRFYEGNVRSLQ